MMADKGMRKILVVDDDESVRSLCSEALTLAGYRVVTARDGMDAVAMLRRSVYDMVISDVNMPRLNGMSLYAHILKDHPYIKDRFLFVSGSPTEELHKLLSETGVENLKKPFTLSALMDRVDSVLSGAPKTYRRAEARVSWKARCELSGGEGWRRKTLAADTDNISRCGVKLRLGAGPLRAGMTLNVTMATGLPGPVPGHTLVIERSARVVWSRARGRRGSEAGVVFSEPVPASDIAALSLPVGPAS